MKDRQKIGIVYGALAFDLRVADRAHRRRLDKTEAEALAAALRRSLIAECADVRALRLMVGAAFYDPCALLRVGWPLHRRLRALSAALDLAGADRAGAGLAGAHRAGNPTDDRADDRVATVGEDGLPEPQGLADARYLLSVPFVLEGPAADAKEAARHFDRSRMLPYKPRARNAAFELPALPAFDAVGYLSLRGLSTEVAARYYAEGLGDAWALIERALLQPALEHRVELRSGAIPDQPSHSGTSPSWLQYADGEVRIACSDSAYAERCRILLHAHGFNVMRVDARSDETTNVVRDAEA
jgi:hypothetical protein